MKTLSKAVASVTTVSLCLGTAAAQDFLKKWGLTYGGYLDGYYQYDFGRPASGDSVNGRGFDIAHQRPNIAFAEFDLSRATDAKSPFGFTLNLYAGRGPEIIHLSEPGGRNKYRYVRQAYVTYSGPGKNPVTVDFGKFDTWIGYEGIDNRFQDQYSRSFNWTYSEPTYVTGLRIGARLNDKLNGTLYVVQGWNEVEDGNSVKSVGATLAYSPDANTTFTLQNHYGVEGSDKPNDAGSFGGIGFPNPGTATVQLGDLIVTRQLTPATKIALNIDYASSAGATNGGHWNGEVFYLRHQLRANSALSFRAERMEDSNGLRVGLPIMFTSLTATYDRALDKSSTLRLEVRHDTANRPFFNSETGPVQGRTTATVAAIVKF